MCLLVVQYNKKGQKKSSLITKKTFEDSWESNPHGFGLGYFDKDRQSVLFHSMKMDDSWEAYKDHHGRFRGHMIVHWRYATQGLKDESNCHPFLTDHAEPMILGHNGVLTPIPPDCPKDWSDTHWFAKNMTKILKVPNKIGHVDNDKEIKYYLNQSRLAILEPDNTIHTWQFPHQPKDLEEYGLFSVTALRKRTYTCYNNSGVNNWEYWNNQPRHNFHPAYQNRKIDHKQLSYIDPKAVDKESFYLPQTFWLFELLETNAYLDFEMVMRRFHARFGRFPTSQESMGAFSLTTKNKEKKPKETPIVGKITAGKTDVAKEEHSGLLHGL